MIHTFSPNWYKPQCLLFHQNDLFYASNYILYRYNLQTRKVEADKCFRKIAIKTNMNSKDIKIHSIKILAEKEKWLIIGTNQQHTIILNMGDLQVVGVVRNISVQSVYICQTGYSQQDSAYYAIFADQTHGISKLTIRTPTDYKSKTIQNQKFAKQKVKQIYSFTSINMIVYGKGQILFMDKNFNKIIQQIQSTTIGLDQQYILSLDIWEQSKGQTMWACMLTRSKNNNIYIHYWSISVVQKQQTKEVSQVRIIYPKAMNQKIKNTQKAAMTIKFIQPSHILLSTKLGQLVIVNLQKSPQQITIKPHSLDDIPPYFQLIPDSKHYKQIYSIYVHSTAFSPYPQLYTISTDQTLGIWNIIQKTLQFSYNIKFITAELTSIFYSEADNKTVFLLLKDSNIRSMVPFSTQNYYLNQYWKFTKKFKICKVAMHLEQSGIAAMVTQCNRILLYDLFDDRLMKIHDFSNKVANDEIINISFQYKSILQPIQKLTAAFDSTFQSKWQLDQLKIQHYYSKNIKNNSEIGLLVQQKTKLVYIYDTQQKQNHQEILSIKRVCRLQRIHHTKFWDKNILLFSQYKGNNLKIWMYCKGQILKLQSGLKLSGRCIFKVQYPCIKVVQYKGKKACIHNFKILQQTIKKQNQLDLQLPVFSQQVVLDYHSCQAIFYNGKDDMLVHVEFNNTQSKISCLEVGNKIQNLSFYFSDYIIIGFKDQSIKVLKLSELINIKDQPYKKVKKTIQNNNNLINQNKQKQQHIQQKQVQHKMMSLQQ